MALMKLRRGAMIKQCPKYWQIMKKLYSKRGFLMHPSHIYELLMGAFAEQRRSVVKFIVDGKDALTKRGIRKIL